jgi:hypothetical protein
MGAQLSWLHVVLPLGALLCFYGALRFWRLARSIADTAVSRVRSAPQGYVELYGRAEFPPQTTQRAPLSGRDCVWWWFSIERRVGSGRYQRWDKVNGGSSVAPFLLRDDTGACLVDPRGADVKPSASDTWYGALPWPSGPLTTGRLSMVIGEEYRYREHRLYQYDMVCALGEFRTVGGLASGDLEADVTTLLHHWKEDQAALLKRFDTDGNGVLSAAEWEQARAAARAQIQAQRAQAPTLNVVARPRDDRPYLLAASDPAHLAQRYRWRAAASVAGFLVALASFTELLLHT